MGKTFNLQSSTFNPLFYPAWEVLPHEGKLPHADTISDRLQTLVALSKDILSEGGAPRRPNCLARQESRPTKQALPHRHCRISRKN
jgi:transcription-repair coupling factor (superfamily II helicase)